MREPRSKAIDVGQWQPAGLTCVTQKGLEAKLKRERAFSRPMLSNPVTMSHVATYIK